VCKGRTHQIISLVDVSLIIYHLLKDISPSSGKSSLIGEEDAQLIVELVTEFAVSKNSPISISKNRINTMEDLQSVLQAVVGELPPWISFSYNKGNIYSIEYPDTTE